MIWPFQVRQDDLSNHGFVLLLCYFQIFEKLSEWSHVASNLSALSCKAQKTILFLTILRAQMVEGSCIDHEPD
jgi:hypothetical protein